MDNFQVVFRELHYWAHFQIIREYGTWPLLAGFALGAVGLIMRLVIYQKRIKLLIQENDGTSSVYLSGDADFFSHSFAAELEQIMVTLRDLEREG